MTSPGFKEGSKNSILDLERLPRYIFEKKYNCSVRKRQKCKIL